MKNLRSFPLGVLASALFLSTALAQQVAPTVRIVNHIDESNLVTLKGNTHPSANAKNDRGAVSPGFAMPDLILVLSRSPEQQAAFDSFVASQTESGSPNYHQWLTPAQIGAQYGPAQADIASITSWLSSHGLTVEKISPDGMTIRFGGTAAQVESAFHASIHNLSVNGVTHYANMTDPQIPAALAPVVLGVKALHNFLPHPQHKMGSLVRYNKEAGKWQRIATTAAAATKPTGTSPIFSALKSGAQSAFNPHPLFGENGCIGTSCATAQYLEEDVTPSDFATIYNVQPLWNASITGTGQTIAIAGTSFINLGANSNANKNSTANDVATYRSAFGLPAGLTPNEIDTGGGPAATICTSTSSTAYCGIGDLTENSLDVEVSGAVAPGAQIDLVVTGQNSTGTIDTLYDSASYVVNNVTAKILSLSYGECELGQGTAGNVAYYDLWQSAAAEGISVFVSTGDSGSPSCDDDFDSYYGDPYVAQFGLSVNGIASTPYNTAVGGTDFSWCQPYYNSSGDYEGCPISSTTQTAPAYWSTSNNSTTGASALGYVPEIPWNDSCENPIQAKNMETLFAADGSNSFDAYAGVNPTTPEETCNVIYKYWSTLDEGYQTSGLEDLVDSVGGSGGASGCVVNSTVTTSNTYGTCTSGATSTGATTNPDTGAAQGALTLYNNGWPKPSWQTGVAGIPSDGVRDIPDVSLFAGNGALGSATLICVSNDGACTYSASITTTTQYDDTTAQEVGGTSVGTPEMAGVMALINQKSGGAQGLANKQLYQLATAQTYSECSAESTTSSSSCYFQDIDNGPSGYSNAQTNSMPCAISAGTIEGNETGETTAASPNCVALNSGDTIGTLVTSGNTQAYNSATGFDLATGLGSMNIANVVNHWVSDAGTNATTMTVGAVPSTITINQAMAVTVSVVGSGNTPTGTITLIGDGYNSTETIGTSPCTSNTNCVFNIPANTLAAGSGLILTASYNGDSNFAENSKTTTVNVNLMTPTVTPSASNGNIANATPVKVTVTGPAGSVAIPSGTVYLKSGSYTSGTATLVNGSTTITIPAGSLVAGSNTLTVDYSGDSNYAGNTGSTQITMSQTVTLTPAITVTPTPGSIDSGQSLSVNVAVTGAGPTPTGSIYLKSGSYTSSTETIGVSPCTSSTTCVFTIPSNSISAGTDTLTAYYGGDVNYASGTGTGSVSVTQSAYTLAASAPTTVAPGSSTTSTVTGTSTTDYSGTVTLSSCALTTSPSGAVSVPTCSVSGTITYSSGTATGSGTATVNTTAVSTAMMVRPKTGNGWLGAGSGAVLALLVFFGIPAKRKSWRAMLGALALIAVLGSMAACGGGGSSGGGGTSIAATTAGSYTFTVSGTGNDPSTTAGSTTFTVTVN